MIEYSVRMFVTTPMTDSFLRSFDGDFRQRVLFRALVLHESFYTYYLFQLQPQRFSRSMDRFFDERTYKVPIHTLSKQSLFSNQTVNTCAMHQTERRSSFNSPRSPPFFETTQSPLFALLFIFAIIDLFTTAFIERGATLTRVGKDNTSDNDMNNTRNHFLFDAVSDLREEQCKEKTCTILGGKQVHVHSFAPDIFVVTLRIGANGCCLRSRW